MLVIVLGAWETSVSKTDKGPSSREDKTVNLMHK